MASTACAFTFWQMDLKLVFVSPVRLCFLVGLFPTFHAVAVKAVRDGCRFRQAVLLVTAALMINRMQKAAK
jgi:hypothetical protein